MKVTMRPLCRHAVSCLAIVAASNASAGVITQDGVVFTSTYTGKVLMLEIDAANRSGGWAGASAIDALSLKTIGSFSGVKMSSGTGASWSMNSGELTAKGCSADKGKGGADDASRLCYTGAAVALADKMIFMFSFDGAPTLAAPHLKVHFVDARGNKVGSLLSLDFPATAPAPAPVADPVPAPVLVPVQAPVAEPVAPAAPPGVVTPPVPELAVVPVFGPGIGGGNADIGNMPPVVVPDAGMPADVPEPQSIAIMAAGIAVMGAARRRKRRLPA